MNLRSEGSWSDVVAYIVLNLMYIFLMLIPILILFAVLLGKSI